MLDKDINYTIETATAVVTDSFNTAGIDFGHGTDNAWDEACWLVLHALKLPPIEAPDFQRQLSLNDVASINHLLNQRIALRLPMAYITGTAWFAGLEFKCDSRALVPRSPLAEWIVEDFFGFSPVNSPSILDLCTGGGCIAIAVAVHHPRATVTASDLSRDAIALARENVALHGVEQRVSLVTCSLFEGLSGPFDLIVSNPPYVDAADFLAMPDEFRHEPAMALGAGEDGLDIVHQILKQAENYLTEHGMLIVEVGNSQSALIEAYPEVPFVWLEFQSGGAGVFALTRDDLARLNSS